MQELLMWWNLPFVLPFIAGVGYILLMATGTVASEHDVDVGVDHEFDAGIDADHDVELDHDASVEHAAEFGHDHDHGLSEQQQTSIFQAMLGFIGVGKVPLSILLVTFCLLWGFFGYSSNIVFKSTLHFPLVYFWLSLAFAFLGAVFFTRTTATVLGRVMPSTQTYASKSEDLVGKTGTAIYDITPRFGSVQVRDQFDNLQEMPCVTADEQTTIAKGSKVLIVEYDGQREVFIVATSRTSSSTV